MQVELHLGPGGGGELGHLLWSQRRPQRVRPRDELHVLDPPARPSLPWGCRGVHVTEETPPSLWTPSAPPQFQPHYPGTQWSSAWDPHFCCPFLPLIHVPSFSRERPGRLCRLVSPGRRVCVGSRGPGSPASYPAWPLTLIKLCVKQPPCVPVHLSTGVGRLSLGSLSSGPSSGQHGAGCGQWGFQGAVGAHPGWHFPAPSLPSPLSLLVGNSLPWARP